jgi:hypothetical protein
MESESAIEFKIEFFRSFGEYFYEFSFIEELMKQFINSLLDSKDDDVGSCITADMPFNGLYHSLMSLYRLKEKDPLMVEKLEKVLGDIKGLEERRNKFIHSIWKIDPKTSTAKRSKRTAKFGVGLNRDDKKYNIAEINKENDLLKDAVIILFNILDDWETRSFLVEK